MKLFSFYLAFVLAFALLTSCNKVDRKGEIPRPGVYPEVNPLGSRKLGGQKVYVPVYSSIHTWKKDQYVNLTVVLSIRNISSQYNIIVSKVSYFNTNGKLIREYIEKPFSLGPIATREFVVNEDDVAGGTGANFIVEWESENKVSIPIIESVMIGTKGVQGISFISRGKEMEYH